MRSESDMARHPKHYFVATQPAATSLEARADFFHPLPQARRRFRASIHRLREGIDPTAIVAETEP